MAKRILYVDDEDDIREIAAMALELEPSFEVRTCASGTEALDAVREAMPDLIMLDVMMPDLDGPSTLARLQAREGPCLAPVLFCTARTQAADIDGYLALGAVGVVSKPFDPMSLASTVVGYLSK